MPQLWYTDGSLIARTKNEIEPETEFTPPVKSPDSEFNRQKSLFKSFDHVPLVEGESAELVTLSPSKAAQRGREFLVRRAIREYREGINLDVFLQSLGALTPADLFTSVSIWEERDPARPRSAVKHRAAIRLQLYQGDNFTLSITHRRCGGDRISVLVEGFMVVGTFVRKQDGVWYFTTTSKATLNLDDQPVLALIYETDFTATAENVAMMKDNKSRVTSMKIQGELPSHTVDEVTGPNLLTVKLAAEGAKPIDLKTLVDDDNDGVPDELAGWVAKLWGPNPPPGRRSLYLCPSSGDVFLTMDECEKFTVLKGFTDFCKLEFWIYLKPAVRPGAPQLWDVTTHAINPTWRDMYGAINDFDAVALDEMWAADRNLLAALDLHGASLLHYLIRAAAKDTTDKDQRASAAEILRLVLVQGGNSNTAGPNGQTPLHLAAEAGLDDLVELLLIKDGSKKAQTEDKDGKKPIDLARENGHESVSDMLHGYSRSPKKTRAIMFG